MRSNTDSKTERRILAIFWSTLFMIGILAACRVYSIHVTSVRRKEEKLALARDQTKLEFVHHGVSSS